MRDLRLFGTKEYPIHPSGIRTLLICPWRAVMDYLSQEDGVGGQAGDTGSATHVAVAELHRGKGAAECLRAMGERIREYPLADLKDASAMFLNYAADPRNRNIEVVLIERPVSFSIEAAPNDETQARIEVEGTVDQVRKEATGRYFVWDLKTSKKDPTLILHQTLFQAAAYCVGASVALGVKAEPGGIIMPRRYPGNAFWKFPWKFEDIEQILLGLRIRVADIRAGRVHHHPTDECTWCRFKTPDVCLPQLQEVLRVRHDEYVQSLIDSTIGEAS